MNAVIGRSDFAAITSDASRFEPTAKREPSRYRTSRTDFFPTAYVTPARRTTRLDGDGFVPQNGIEALTPTERRCEVAKLLATGLLR
jgi:hypothetical protein